MSTYDYTNVEAYEKLCRENKALDANLINKDDSVVVMEAKKQAQLQWISKNYDSANDDLKDADIQFPAKQKEDVITTKNEFINYEYGRELSNSATVGNIYPSTNTIPGIGDTVLNTITNEENKVLGIKNGGDLIIGYNEDGTPKEVSKTDVANDNTVVTEKGIKEAETTADADNEGNNSTPSTIQATKNAIADSTKPNNVSAINQSKYYARPQTDKLSCYVVNNLTGTIIEFMISPEDISDNLTATFDDIHPKNRTSPIKGFNNSGPRDISFSITLHNDYCKDGLLHTVRQLQALTLPAKSAGFVKAPNCKVVIGKMININGVCTSVGVNWKKPYHDEIYSMAEISLSFNEVQDTSVFCDEWENKE